MSSVRATAAKRIGSIAGRVVAHATNGGPANGAAVPAADMSYPARRVSAPLGPGELAPFDSDGT